MRHPQRAFAARGEALRLAQWVVAARGEALRHPQRTFAARGEGLWVAQCKIISCLSHVEKSVNYFPVSANGKTSVTNRNKPVNDAGTFNRHIEVAIRPHADVADTANVFKEDFLFHNLVVFHYTPVQVLKPQRA